MTIKTLIAHFYNGDLEAFSAELDRIDNICERDGKGKTILMHLVSASPDERSSNHLAFLTLLVKKGGEALVNAWQNTIRKTALTYAAEVNYTEGVYLLLEHGADPNVENFLKQNTLSSVLSEDCIFTAEALVHYGVEVKNDICFSTKIDQRISALLWGALRPMPESVPVEDRTAFYRIEDMEENELSLTEPLSISRQSPEGYLAMAKKHNENLSKHPTVVGRDLAEHTPLPQRLTQTVFGYLYGDETRSNNADRAFTTRKAIIFSEEVMSPYMPQPIVKIVSGYLCEEENESEVEKTPAKKRKRSE